MLASGITLIVGLLSESAIMAMFGQHIPGNRISRVCDRWVLLHRPVAASMVAWLNLGSVVQHLSEHDTIAVDAWLRR